MDAMQIMNKLNTTTHTYIDGANLDKGTSEPVMDTDKSRAIVMPILFYVSHAMFMKPL